MRTLLMVTLEGCEPRPDELDHFAGQIMSTAECLFPGDCQVSYSEDNPPDIDKFNQVMTDIEEAREWDPASIQLP